MAKEKTLEEKEQLLKRQKRQMKKIKALGKKLTDYEQSGLADSTSLNLDFEERDTIQRALTCHLCVLQLDLDKIQKELKANKEEDKNDTL